LYTKTLEIKTLYVLNKYRRKGLGTELCKKVDSFAKEKKCQKIILSTSTTLGFNFFQSLNYKNVNTEYIGYRPVFKFEKVYY
jgi:ribosomal protein S18 acetylase RimI-like enzyme